jgi:pseudaminic acid synthase
MKCKKNKLFGSDRPCLVVAEISANHGQDFGRAVRMIKMAKQCGAGAVKFQCYTPDTLTIDVNNKYFRIKHAKWGGQTLYQLYKKAYTPWGWFKKLKIIAEDSGLVFFATAFDKTSVDFLEELGVAFHKIASFELIDLPLIEYAAKTKKPLILSTGMATIREIREAVNLARESGVKDITLFKCVSSYPASPKEMNLRTIMDMKTRFGCNVGLSDHTLGIGASVAAVCLGARIIEKHFILSRKENTPDSFFSVEPLELKELIANIRIVEQAIGEIHYGLTDEEKKSLVFRRSLFAVKDIEKGEVISAENMRSIRPANGMPPKYYKALLGRKTRVRIERGTPLNSDMVR